MKVTALFSCLLMCGCVWREEKDDLCQKEEALNEARDLTIAAASSPWGDDSAMNEAVLRACRMWEPVGVRCSLGSSPEVADIYVDFYSDSSCKLPAFAGSFAGSGDARPGVWVNYDVFCRPYPWGDWLAHLVAHEIGHLFGVDDVPRFCGEAVMNPSIERALPTPYLASITDADRHSFAERFHTSALLGDALVNDCGNGESGNIARGNEPEAEICAEDVEETARKLSLWIEDELDAWRPEIIEGCSWWSPVRFSCQLAGSAREADVLVRAYPQEYGCGIAGYTYRDWGNLDGRYAVEINIWCMPDESEPASLWMRNVSAHEFGHTQGAQHVPFWCGEAVMNPGIQPKTCISSADVSAWHERYAE